MKSQKHQCDHHNPILGKSGLKSKKGMALMYDVIIACALLFVGMAVAASLLPPPLPSLEPDLQGYATSVLLWLDSRGVLADCVYRQDAKALYSALSPLMPSGAGFCLRVYSPNWELLWTFTSPDFDEGKASASQPYPLSGYQGVPDPKIVLLLISK